MSLRKRIIDIFYRAATGTRKVRNLLTPLGFVFFIAVITVFVIISIMLDKFLRFPNLFSGIWSIVLAWLIIVMGIFLILWSVLTFFKAKGTPVPFNPPPKIVTTGPYAYVRNPMLTGVFILMFELGILFNLFSFVFIFTPLFILFTVMELKAVEEPELEKRLGKEYLEYKKRTPMFIPGLRIRTKK
ncbi:MAG: isoprenylcysteine carboxylmethyltransferase family protein [Actinobacteria bacterium]|nr:isoprenylcysteine carboxylmethyltransferase family protein [Actinomycetota bacterium]